MANKHPSNPIKKGETRNPNGRPKKGETFTDIIQAKVDKESIVKKLEQLAMKGDVTALKYLVDRCDGTPTQAVKVGGLDDTPPVKINVLGVATPQE